MSKAKDPHASLEQQTDAFDVRNRRHAQEIAASRDGVQQSGNMPDKPDKSGARQTR